LSKAAEALAKAAALNPGYTSRRQSDAGFVACQRGFTTIAMLGVSWLLCCAHHQTLDQLPLPAHSGSMRDLRPMEVILSGAALGAELRGIDLKDLDAAAFERVMAAWHEHSVLLFRNQTLGDHDLIAFSRRLGDLDWAPIQETGRRFVEGLPEIYVVSNVIVNAEPIGSLGDGEAAWHTDMSYLEVPPKASMLYSLEIPPAGGNTSFCTMYGIYEALPAPLKHRIGGLKIKHDGTYNSGGYVRQGIMPTDDPVTSPGAVHPLVCTHPHTGRRMLYLGRRRNAYLMGLELAESEALLDELWRFVDDPRFTWEHVWRVGDLVLWDNRCTMHRRDAFDPNSRRIMHRTQVKGEQRPA
jgi:taurine dioxygenase